MKLILNPNNPRTIKKEDFERLKKSIQEFPEMLEKRPIVYDEKSIILGGNMRYRALQELERGGFEVKPEYFMSAEGWTEEQKRAFVIKDNLELGDWDHDVLANEWSDLPLGDWGLDTGVKETEKLSKLEFNDIYYKPDKNPNIELGSCLDLDLFQKKLSFIENSSLSEEKKEILKMFAYRFIRIDFQMVADYYFFNAGEEEKEIIERLRLVLCDGGVDGFIEDHLLRVYEILGDWND